jgi:hypothetical protein
MARERQKQFKVGLSAEMRKELEQLANQSGRSIADEIRVRVFRDVYHERSFDRATRNLQHEIGQLAREIAMAIGNNWHEHPLAYAALVEAINVWLEGLRPQGRPDKDHANLDARTVGQTIARVRQQGLAAILRGPGLPTLIRGSFHAPEKPKPRKKSK